MLEEEVTDVEIKKEVCDCGSDKSPRPDGFTFEFIKKFWEVIGGDVCRATRCFFRSGSFPKGCNTSFIALIPKVNDAKFMKDFRPISLIGCQYNIVGKILANRLSLVIDGLVSKEQSAFVRDRQILYCHMILIPIGVLKRLESFRSNFLRGVDLGGRKASWFSWDRVVASKEVGGLGISSFFAMNRALLFKWIWRFKALPEPLWVLVIKAIHGPCGRGVDLFSCMYKNVGNGNDTLFWSENLMEDEYRQGGTESMQLEDLSNKLCSLELVDEQDSWSWNLNGEGVFTVSSARRFIDDGICVLDGNETSDHLFFSCSLASAMIFRFFKWWELPDMVFQSYHGWENWLDGLRLRRR
nr:RNA-directed DNA polymerase, eukaryota [Tanacetum cinerariifolium]